jgi:hypothetical protein
MRRLKALACAGAVAAVFLTGEVTGWAQTTGDTDRAALRLRLSTIPANVTFQAAQAPAAPRKRSWIGRHPVLFGALVGAGSGFLIGYLPGDDGVFYDFTAGFNGTVIGGVGALTGAVAGAIVGETTK